MQIPGTLRRAFARMIDTIVLVPLWLPLIIQVMSSWSPASRTCQISLAWKWIFLCSALQLLYRILFLRFLGGTIGKLVLGLRLVPKYRPDQALTWMQVLIRVLADQLSIFFGEGLFCLALLRFDRTHVSDWLAETRVVRTGSGAEAAPSRHLFWGLMLFLYFSITGFSSMTIILKNMSWNSSHLVFFCSGIFVN